MSTYFSPLFLVLLCLFSSISVAVHQTKLIGDGNTLLSPDGNFAVGFFSPGNSTFRYVGIWYTFSKQTIVWVANRSKPVPDSTGILSLTTNGTLLLVHRSNITIWESSTTSKAAGNPRCHLSNSGNLIVADSTGTAILWQSFDHPTDTRLPGVKLSVNFRTGQSRFLSNWKSASDPSPGDSTFSMDGNGEEYLRMSGNTVYRSGPWIGKGFSGIPRLSSYADIVNVTFVSTTEEVYSTWKPVNAGTVIRLFLSPYGNLQLLLWIRETRTWTNLLGTPEEECDRYARCGSNGVCSNEAPELCRCYVGYVPVLPDMWRLRQFGGGCRREVEELCGVGEGFRTLDGLKLPDTREAMVRAGMSLDACREMCLRNCSCTAYATLDSLGNECVIWMGELRDTRNFSVHGPKLYLRVPSSLQETQMDEENKKSNVKIVVAVVIPVTAALMAIAIAMFVWRRMEANKRLGTGCPSILWENELQLFDFSSVAYMTGNFADGNKIGEGGFGVVFKGSLADGQAVALKRLSSPTSQGLDEFMNEVVLIAKLQHRNLVRLLGCCSDRDERILVYEFMPNKSLDTFIFDKAKRASLDWRTRVDIIGGIARGLLYLHEDSRFRIIHRDLKAGNILLDEAMNPKISDFGTARIFGTDQIEEKTRRVMGTFGYMSPEYAMDGIFSVKSDVFSFGVLELEIISGRKNKALYQEDEHLNLLDRAWKMWKDGQTSLFVDETIASSCAPEGVLRCVNIGLLCVQQNPADRPTMATVVFMLSNELSPLPQPERPGFWKTRSARLKDAHSGSDEISTSINKMTVTEIVGR